MNYSNELDKSFIDYLPSAGVIAWDLSEQIGLTRIMFKVKSMNITKSTDFMFSIAGYLDCSTLLDTKWIA